jgi:hypothetical protein
MVMKYVLDGCSPYTLKRQAKKEASINSLMLLDTFSLLYTYPLHVQQPGMRIKCHDEPKG